MGVVKIVITGEFSFAMKTLQSMWECVFLFIEFRLPSTKFCNTIIAI